MPDSARHISIFVSSPSDVARERATVRDVADDMNRHLADRLGAQLHVDAWEDWRPATSFRKHLDEHLPRADLFVMIFAGRYGEAAAGEPRGSGTREEFEMAMRLRRDRPGDRPEVFVYFRDIPPDDPRLGDVGPQLEKVLEFKTELRDQNNIFYREYRSADSFGPEFKNHLTDWLFERWHTSEVVAHETKRRAAFRRFFSLVGDEPSTTIVHPVMREQDPGYLLPFIAAEDFHAIRRVTECLHVAGCENVETWTDRRYRALNEYDGLPTFHNRVFICAFSNKAALEALDEIPQRRFRLVAGKRDHRRIIWARNDGTEMHIASPLSRYLEKQDRANPDPHKREDRVGVDFAVLARFCHLGPGRSEPQRSTIYAFGLRSLGTWGAAWFLDNEVGKVTACSVPIPDAGEPFQTLLRVQYRGSRIVEVKDVSDAPPEYFAAEMSDECIDATLAGDRVREIEDLDEQAATG